MMYTLWYTLGTYSEFKPELRFMHLRVYCFVKKGGG